MYAFFALCLENSYFGKSTVLSAAFSYLDDVADGLDAAEDAVELLLVLDLDRHGEAGGDVLHRGHGCRCDRMVAISIHGYLPRILSPIIVGAMGLECV